ncbi:glycogenin-1 isoform X2 [Scaptodrosophila lebanonensis]|uniref:glycogenin glucosyltransferase n=1 Tax=Drosophila lebanonensis TaxID=7225 RepID=A0A6J2UJC9_DROLE|nr:glycogenin-1 isoform X2 [Scaptodrosophila lebanonensis]
MSKFAWVTLTTNDTYSLGALVLAHSLRRAGTAHQLAVLVTPSVSEAMRNKLKDVYNVVQEVNVLDSQDAANLALLSRPELGVTFTKLHCWRLVQFEKCVFLDADTLVLQNCDELFEREELSAAPDVSWPDCFNSGVFVFRPSVDTFGKITEFAVQHGSFDGGDQGLLNQYFADWATADIKKHLPFVYNVTAYASYCYLPAFKQFRDNIKILHFAGKLKPWLIQFNSETKSASTPSEYAHAHDLIQLWWNIFCDNVHERLTDEMCLRLKITHRSRNHEHRHDVNQNQNQYRHQHQHQHDQRQQQKHQQQQQQQQNVIHVKEFRDPWADYYEKQSKEPEPAANVHEHASENVEDKSSYAEAYENKNPDNSDEVKQKQARESQSGDSPSLKPTPTSPRISVEDSIAVHRTEHKSPSEHNPHVHRVRKRPVHSHEASPIVHHTRTDEAAKAKARILAQAQALDQASAQARAQAQAKAQVKHVAKTHEAGLAGALSQLRLGAQRTPEQEQYENLMRRQCWESGQIDYAGRDSFDNIWKKITQTLDAKPAKEADKTGSS